MRDIIVDYRYCSGHTYIAADDGIEAVTMLKEMAVDLAVLDIKMPHVDGFSVC